MLNFNRVWGNLRTMNDFNFTILTKERVLYERSRLLVAVLNTYLSKALLINSINTQSNLLRNFIFVHLLLLEDYEQGALQKDLIIAPLMQQFETATFRKPYW